MKAYNSVLELIGNTPIVKLNNIIKDQMLKANIYAKLEYFNPGGSVKDRIALSIIEEAERSGRINKSSVIIEPTSGNTGIGLSAVGAVLGYRVIITMPDTMSIERINLMKAYGAQVILTPGAKGMAGAIEKANELAKQYPNSIIAGQFDNPVNPQTHIESTGPEIWQDMDGMIDIFVAGVGTGGTLTGTSKYLKSKNSKIKTIAVEPSSSPVLSKGTSGAHKIQGIGAGFVPNTLDTSAYDEVCAVDDEDAMNTLKYLAKKEGIFVGISSGAALYAAIQAAKKDENENKNIVVILPDTGDRYLSLPFLNE